MVACRSPFAILKPMRFTKMHGIGNDYVYVNGFTETVGAPPAVARVISHRHFGVGSDGLILILPSDRADVRMRMFNADGSEAEMCGNGIRCVAKYAFDHGLTKNNPMMVETGRGVLPLELELGADGKVRRVTVNMGEPILSLAEIPVDAANLAKGQDATAKGEHVISIFGGREFLQAAFVSMGNPHAVIFTPDAQGIDLHRLGPVVEHHPAFPRASTSIGFRSTPDPK